MSRRLVAEDVGQRLVELWEANRSRTYYRDGIATDRRATTLIDLATVIHEHVLRTVGVQHECVCDTEG